MVEASRPMTQRLKSRPIAAGATRASSPSQAQRPVQAHCSQHHSSLCASRYRPPFYLNPICESRRDWIPSIALPALCSWPRSRGVNWGTGASDKTVNECVARRRKKRRNAGETLPPLTMDTLGIDHHSHHQHQHQHQHQHHNHEPFAAQELPSRLPRKRKAGALPDNNERLSKRMSLLNLGRSTLTLLIQWLSGQLASTMSA